MPDKSADRGKCEMMVKDWSPKTCPLGFSACINPQGLWNVSENNLEKESVINSLLGITFKPAIYKSFYIETAYKTTETLWEYLE